MMEAERALRRGELGPEVLATVERVGDQARAFGRASGLMAHALQLWWWANSYPARRGAAVAAIRELFLPLAEMIPTFGMFSGSLLDYLGEPDGFRLYEQHIAQHLALPPTSWYYLTGDGGWVFRQINDRDLLERLYGRLASYRGLHSAGGPTTPTVYGYPVAGAMGAAAGVLGRHDLAITLLEEALDRCDDLGAIPSSLQARSELARTLLARGAPGDQDRARTELDRAIQTAEGLELPGFVDQLRAERAGL